MDDDEFGVSGGGGERNVQLPKATVNKFANEVASSLDVRLTADTRELIANCCTEFVQLLSSEANEICEKDSKKTITPEHVLRALRQLGLERYLDEVTAEYEKVRTEDKTRGRAAAKRDRKKKKNLHNNNSPDDAELLRKQQQLFEMARKDPMNAITPPNSAPPPNNSNTNILQPPSSPAPPPPTTTHPPSS